MRWLRLVLAVSTILAACDGQPTGQQVTAEPQSSPAAENQQALLPVQSLAGKWRVAKIDGKPLDEPFGIALSVDEKEIVAEPRCIGVVRRYSINGMRLTVLQLPSSGRPMPPGSQPPPVCMVVPPSRLQDVRRALDAANIIGRNSDNGVMIAGGGHSLLLFRQ